MDHSALRSVILAPAETDGSDQKTPVPIYRVTKTTMETTLSHLGAMAAGWVKAQGYKPGAGNVLCIPGDTGALAAVLFGGEVDGLEAATTLTGKLPNTLPAGLYRLADGFADLDADVLAWVLGSYRFDRYKTRKDQDVVLQLQDDFDLETLRFEAEGVAFARDLINTPANDFGPVELATAAKWLCETHGGTYSEIIGDDLIEQNYPMIHAVGRAADPKRAPRLIDAVWGDEAAPRVTLVGKGVVFDTGGLNLKPGSSMALMKKDMGGAANVLGLAHMVMSAKLPVRLRVLIPAVENAVSGDAFRPGDVLASRNGMTVEIGNTDAEGRLVLADALTLADDDDPDLIIDMATLTGAARVALGPDLPPLYTTDGSFADRALSIGEEIDDPIWPMPLHPRYRTMLDSKIADINHISSGGFAGSITAALFLREFVSKAKAWVHLDIFGWTPSARPARPEGGAAQGIRTLFRLLTERYPS